MTENVYLCARRIIQFNKQQGIICPSDFRAWHQINYAEILSRNDITIHKYTKYEINANTSYELSSHERATPGLV